MASQPPSVALTNPFGRFWWEARRLSADGRGKLALRGGTWSLIGYVSTQALRTVTTLALARYFLGPEAFGLVGLVAVFVAGLGMFSELGILANVVQHPRGDEQVYLNTAFSIQVGRGLAIWLISAAAAYPISLFYHQPEVLPLLIAIGASEFIRGMTSTVAWSLTRHIELRGITLLTIASEALAAVACLVWAYFSPTAWALVARTILSAVVYAVGSHFLTERRVGFAWEKEAARDILHFGGWISLSTAAYFLGSQGERLFLAKLITPAELGCFSLAVMISSVPMAGISQLVNQILLPMISKSVRVGRLETVQDFNLARKLFFALSIIAGVGFLTLSRPFVGLFLKPSYAMTGWMLQAMGVRAAFDLFSAPASSLIIAHGKSKYSAAASATRVVAMVVGIFIAFSYFGIRGATLALVIAQLLSYFPLIAGIRRMVPEVSSNELKWYSVLVATLSLVAYFTAL